MRRKLLLLATLAMVSTLFTGCKDTEHAACAITTSTGKSASFVTYNGADSRYSGEALAANDPIRVEIDKDETVSVDLYCSECGFHETFEFDTIGSHFIYCECPVESEREDSKSPVREYACILISYPQDDSATT